MGTSAGTDWWVGAAWTGETIPQADVLNSPLVLVARTDGEAATMIDSNIDAIDHPHIKGATVPGRKEAVGCRRWGADER